MKYILALFVLLAGLLAGYIPVKVYSNSSESYGEGNSGEEDPVGAREDTEWRVKNISPADNIKYFHQRKSVSTERKNYVGSAQNAVGYPASPFFVHKRKLDIRKHKGKKHEKSLKAILKEIINYINKQSLKAKKKIIKLGRKLKLKISKLGYIRKKDYQSDAVLLDIKQQQIAARGYAQLSAEAIMTNTNETMKNWKILLENVAERIRGTTFLSQMQVFAESGAQRLEHALENRHNVELVQKSAIGPIYRIKRESKIQISELYNISEKQVMDMGRTSADAILRTANNTAMTFNVFNANDEKLKKYVKFIVGKIYDSGKYIADKHTELALGSLKSLKLFRLSIDQTVDSFALLLIQLFQDLVNGKVASSKITETIARHRTEIEDKNKQELKKFIYSITEMVTSLLNDAFAKTDVLMKCSPMNPNCWAVIKSMHTKYKSHRAYPSQPPYKVID